MDTSNIKSNSIASRQAEEKSRAVVEEGKAKIVTPSKTSKIVEDVSAMGNYIKEETPGLFKTLLRNLFLGLINTFLPGGNSSGGRGYSQGGPQMTEYNRAYNQNNGATIRVSNSVYAYENLAFEDFESAQDVLNQMRNALYQYGFVSVFDMYDFAHLFANNTDRNYGWYNLDGAVVVPIQEGYKISLPRAVPVRR